MTLPSFDELDPERLSDASFRVEHLRQLTKIRRLLAGGIFMALVISCFFAKDVLLPVILGLMLALTLSPIVRGASRVGIPAPVSAVALVLGFGIMIAGVGYGVSGPISAWMADAPTMGAQLRTKVQGLTQSMTKVQEAGKQVAELADQGDGDGVQKVAIQQPGILNSAVSNVASAATTMSVALVLALFLLASGDMFRAKMIDVLPNLTEKKRALKIVSGVERAISRYLLTITLINAALGLVIFLLMSVAGLPKPYVWGVVAFALNFLPFLGAAAGVILVTLFSILSFDTLGQAILPPLLYMMATAFEGQLITPTVLGRRLELNTVSVFITVVFWGWLWGIAGALMAVPFLVIVKVVCDNVDSMKTLGYFLGSADMRVERDPPETAARPATPRT